MILTTMEHVPIGWTIALYFEGDEMTVPMKRITEEEDDTITRYLVAAADMEGKVPFQNVFTGQVFLMKADAPVELSDALEGWNDDHL